MQKKYFLIMCFILFLIPFVKAQSNFSLSIGGGYILNFDNNTNSSYWGNGYLINLSSEYFVFKDISIFINSSFQSHFFNTESYNHSRLFYGTEFLAEGKNRKMYELSLGFRLYDSFSILRPFASIGAGILAVGQGEILLTTGFENSDENLTTKILVTKGYSFSQFTMGIGTEILLTNKLKIIIEGRILQPINKGLSYAPLSTSIKLAL